MTTTLTEVVTGADTALLLAEQVRREPEMGRPTLGREMVEVTVEPDET